MEPKYHHAFIGGNFRLDALQAAMLSVKLPHFDAYTAARRGHARLYTELLAQLPGVRVAGPRESSISINEKEDATLILPSASVENESIWNQYTLRVIGPGRRDALRAYLSARGIGSEIYYPVPLHEQACFASLGYQPDDLPWAHRLAGEVLSLPVYPELPEAQLREVCSAIGEFLRG
jgi:dTDP-4-amino-4,6-dideoxygalactose transaminase